MMHSDMRTKKVRSTSEAHWL